MASLAVVLIILGCVAYQYFKGTLVRAFAMIIIAVCASLVAFGFFEVLANVVISRGGNSRLLALLPWTRMLFFLLLFIVVFALLQSAMMFLTRRPVDLEFLPERIGRVVCGIILGFILSGLLLTALSMAPLPVNYPYRRFDGERHIALLNADGFATGLFTIISKGSFSGKRSFAVVHPDYLDQLSLNRAISGTSIITGKTPAISLPKKAVWPASEGINEQVGQLVSDLNRQGRLEGEVTGKSIFMPPPVSSDYQPTIVRVGIKRSSLTTRTSINGCKFLLSQLRLICKRQGSTKDPLAGNAINVYPIGHMKAEDRIQVCAEIILERGNFEQNAKEKWIDFVFCIPRDFVPIAVEFKQNNIVEIPPTKIATADQVPPPVFYTQIPKSENGSKKTRSSSPPSGPPRQQRNRPYPGQRQPGDSRRSTSYDEE